MIGLNQKRGPYMEVTIQILVYVILVVMFGFELWLSLLNYQNRNAELPDVVKDVYDEKAYQAYQAYSMTNYKFGLYVKSIDLIVTLTLLLSGFFVVLSEFTHKYYPIEYFETLMYLLFYYLIVFVVETIVKYIHTFRIEEAFGFNRTTKKTFFVDRFKSLILTIVFGGGLIYGLLALYKHTNAMFFVYAWIGLIAIVVIVNLIYTSVLLPLFNKLTPLEDGSLKTKIEDFARSVGYEVGRISVMDASKRSSKLNAFFSGFGKTKRIVLYDTLIEKMSEDEIVAVLGHEIGHNKHKHIIYNLFQTAVIFSVYILLLMVFLEEDIFSLAFGFQSKYIGFNLILYVIILSPILMFLSIIGSFISRKFEYQADDFVKKHGDAEKLISALKVLARENFSNLTPHPLYVKLYYSHPPVADRIRALK